MRMAGITAEFNPFHAGHEYLLRCVDNYYGDEPHIKIAVMSGDYVQRGEPAVFDKYRRAEEALRRGADIVLEMPVVCALSSAEGFAQGAIDILAASGVERVFFGSESGNREELIAIANLLANEPFELGEKIRRFAATGMSFPKARAAAVSEYLAEKNLGEAKGAEDILSTPNDILGIEYAKAIYRCGYEISIEPIKRLGQAYNDSNICEAEQYPSATALRTAIAEELERNGANAFLHKEGGNFGLPVFSKDFSALLRMRLLDIERSGITPDINGDLLNSLLGTLDTPHSLPETAECVKSKRFTYSAISRSLMHIVLGLPEKNTEAYRKTEENLPYARLLGFRRTASAALREIQDRGELKLITKPAEGKGIKGFTEDVRCSRIYNQMVYDKYGIEITDEYRRGPIIL